MKHGLSDETGSAPRCANSRGALEDTGSPPLGAAPRARRSLRHHLESAVCGSLLVGGLVACVAGPPLRSGAFPQGIRPSESGVRPSESGVRVERVTAGPSTPSPTTPWQAIPGSSLQGPGIEAVGKQVRTLPDGRLETLVARSSPTETLAEQMQALRNEARRRLIRHDCPTDLSSGFMRTKTEGPEGYQETAVATLWSSNHGFTLDEAEAGPSITPLHQADGTLAFEYTLTFRARVVCVAPPDSHFTVQAWLGRGTQENPSNPAPTDLQSRDSIKVWWKSTADGYITLLSWGADDQVRQLFPPDGAQGQRASSTTRAPGFTRAGELGVFSGDAQSELVVYCPAAQQRCQESIWVLLTRQPFVASRGWLPDEAPPKDFTPLPQTSLGDFLKSLNQQDRRSWDLVPLPYTLWGGASAGNPPSTFPP